MKELSVFVDESGNFGQYDPASPYYIISMVFHDQDINIIPDIEKLDENLFYTEMDGHCIHAGPLIRREAEFINVDLRTRQKILRIMMNFFRRVDVRCKTFSIDKKDIAGKIDAIGKLTQEISPFMISKHSYFSSFDKIKIYYDNGQIEVTKILSTVFNMFLANVEFKMAIPSEYRLFQLADLLCTLTLTKLKYEKHALSKSESMFFEDERTLRKNYLKLYTKKCSW